MTRQQMANAVDGAALLVSSEPVALLVAAAAELRKTCVGCKHFGTRWSLSGETLGICYRNNSVGWPANGTGYCHEWSAK